MKNSKFKNRNFRFLFGILHFALCIVFVEAQSTNQSYPTAVTGSEISGRIQARDVGDARLTSYFYIFGGGQGDVFINVQTTNFNGDVDVFTHGSLKPLTKITVYADDAASETGRVVYLRQPAKLILRIEGRSPNDDAATFRIKFAGSFEPVQAIAENSATEVPEVKSENQTDVRVNSVGTIVEVKPKPLPSPKETVAKKEVKPRRKKSAGGTESKTEARGKEVAADENQPAKTDVKEISVEEKPEETIAAKSAAENEKKTAPVVVVTDTITKRDETKTDTANSTAAVKEKSIEIVTETPAKSSRANRAKRAAKAKPKSQPKTLAEPNPLENVRLIVLFKDGTRIERAMSEIIKVGVDKGTLTVIAKDGSIGRYSILDVAKMTIE